jgi:DNA-binding SARP family transcriptional activator
MATAMSTLRVHLFGSPRILLDDRVRRANGSRSVEGLLAYLMVGRHRRHPREKLGGLFWPELPANRARSALSTALWRLRQLVETPPTRSAYVQTAVNGDVGFNPGSDYWLDVEEFERQARSDQAGPLTAAIGLHQGDFLEGFGYEWVAPERDRFRVMHLDAMSRLLELRLRDDDAGEAAELAQRILHLDPLREDAHRALIGTHLRLGRRALAARQYESCRQTLRAELGIDPMPATRDLYEAAMSGASADSVDDALRALATATAEFEQARGRVRQARARYDAAIGSAERSVGLPTGDAAEMRG